MGAKQKLNSIHVVAAAVVAGLFGAATQSAIVFLVVLAVVVATGVYAGAIRK